MHGLVLALIFLTSPFAAAQAALEATQVAEFAGGLSQPHDAAFSPDGRFLFVTDMRNSRMRVLEAMTLKLVGTFGEGELSNPHDATFDQAGRLLVADTGNDRIAIYAVSGAQATPAGEIRGLAGPEGVAVASDGRVLATITRGNSLSVFRDGRLQRSVGRAGARDGEFASPHDVAVAPDGRIYVVDSGNHRVQVFSADLEYQGSFGQTMALKGPKYLDFDSGQIWLADEYNHRILLLDTEHRPIGVLGTGQRGRGPAAYYQPEAVLARAPYVWVVDTYNDRIVLLRIK